MKLSMHPHVAIPALFLLLLPALTAGGWRHDVDRAVFRAQGQRAEFAAVGRTVRDGSADRGGGGTLIAPDWVLTAAHVVDRWSPGDDIRFEWGQHSVGIAEVHLHPSYATASSLDARVDLALVRLDRPIRAVEPLPLYVGDDELGMRIAFVGFGFAQPANTLGANQTPPGEKYAGFNRVDSVTANHFFFDVDSPNEEAPNALGSPEPDSLEYGPLGGDSGGGALAHVDGTWYLIGVIGSTPIDFSHIDRYGWYGIPGRINRVSPVLDWVTETTGATPSAERPRS